MRRTLPTLDRLADDPPKAGGYLIDLDGTLMSGGSLMLGAIRFLNALRAPFVILSNDSEHMPHEIAEAFRKRGVDLPQQNIILAGVVAVEIIAARTPGAAIMLLGSAALGAHACGLGLCLDSDSPDIVVVARDRGFTFEKLAAAAKAVKRGARVILACPDTSHPGPSGEPVPEVGALAAALFACVGEVPYEVIGKPEATLFRIGCERLGMAPAQCLMVGDNPLTDGAGASRAGIAFCEIAGVTETALAS